MAGRGLRTAVALLDAVAIEIDPIVGARLVSLTDVAAELAGPAPPRPPCACGRDRPRNLGLFAASDTRSSGVLTVGFALVAVRSGCFESRQYYPA